VYTLPKNCQSGTEYRLELDFYGIGSVPYTLYITLDANIVCPR
jgi:hypothetical protein